VLAIIEAAHQGLLQRQSWAQNILAGVIVAVVALPLAMAFAIASGAKPEQGLYTAIVASLIVSLCGGTRVQIAGPTGAFVVILLQITNRYGISGLQLATLMAGVLLLLAGFFKLGTVIRFIPEPVIVGFTAGIGIVIWVGEWKDFFGLKPDGGAHFHERLWHLLEALPHLNPTTTVLGASVLLLVVYGPKVPGLHRIPGPFIGLVAATTLQSAFHFPAIATLGSAFGGIPYGLPALHLPSVTAPELVDLIGPAFTIALLGAVESLLSAVVADGMAGTRHDSNQELLGQGLANVLAPLFGGFAATGAIARTATNIRNGGNSPIAGVVHALTLVLVVLVLAPLAADVPLAALAAILFVVAWNMSGARHFVRLVRQAPRADAVILLVTCLLTVFADLVVAVNIGVILAILQFLRRMAASVEVKQHSAQELSLEFAHQGMSHLPPRVLVYSIEGPFFFGAAETVERALIGTGSVPRVLIIRLLRVPFMDFTGLQRLQEVIQVLRTRGVRVILSDANVRVQGKLSRAGLLEQLGPEGYFAHLPEALKACRSVQQEIQPDPL
jgi:sulfate permease, SulP family